MAVRSERISHNAAGHAVKACGEIDPSRLREAGTDPALKRSGIPDLQVWEDVIACVNVLRTYRRNNEGNKVWIT
jgi:hypothetical protein